MNLNHLKGILMYVIINWLVRPQEQHSTWITTHVYSPGIFTKTDTGTDLDMDMDTLPKVVDHGHNFSEGFDSAEFVLLIHSHRISVATKDQFRLRYFRRNTSNQYTPIPHSAARHHPRQRSRKTLRQGGYNLAQHGIKFILRALRGAPLSIPTENTHAPLPGPWNPHHGLSIWCVQGRGFATY